MRKEQVIAIILGSFIGVAVAFGIWRLSRANQNKTPEAPQVKGQDNQIQTLIQNGKLAIVSPQPNAVLVNPETTVSGFTRPNAPVAAYAGKVYTKEATGSGEFSMEIELTPGFNTIVVWSFDKGKAPEKTELTMIQTSKISADTSALQASLGTVTDIAEDSLQIRSKDGEIVQLSLTDETTYGSIIEDSTKELDFKDLAIGDLVAALGTKNSSGVLEISRVLVTTEPKAADVVAIVGTIKTFSAREFIVSSVEGKEISVDATGTVSTYARDDEGLTSTRLSNAEEGADLAIIGSFEDDELVATTIILL